MGEMTGADTSTAAAAVIAAAACAVVAVWTVVLAIEDAASRRLPDSLTLPAAGVALLYSCFETRGWVGLVWPAAYLVGGRGFGGGDVKLAVPLGVFLACVGGVGAVLLGMLAASTFTVVFLLSRGLKSAPHGPSMLASAWIVGFASAFLPGV